MVNPHPMEYPAPFSSEIRLYSGYSRANFCIVPLKRGLRLREFKSLLERGARRAGCVFVPSRLLRSIEFNTATLPLKPLQSARDPVVPH
jgi:hypothetical protein